MLVAFAIAIAIHEVLAGVVPRSAAESAAPEVVTRVEIARIERRALPTPTPSPPPAPMPRIVSHARVIAPVESHLVANTVTGKSARKETVAREAANRPKPPPMHVKPIWDLPVPIGGQGAGAGNKSDAGSLGNGGTGSGAGNSGTGGGAAAGNEPCGFVDFQRLREEDDPATHRVWESVSIIVHFPDHHIEAQPLDYPFYYPNKSLDPFAQPEGSGLMLFQWPPADKRASEPALVQYVMQHSAPPGITTLKDCP